MNDKYYIGFYNEEQLIAIMDLIINYPKKGTCYIGIFMINIEKQNSGIGSKIINELFEYFITKVFKVLNLVMLNKICKQKVFWLKNGFEIVGSQQQELFNVICMRKVLKGSGKNE